MRITGSLGALLTALQLLLAPAGHAQGIPLDEVPPILLRDPGALPRAAPGRWEGAFDPLRRDEVIGAISDAAGRAAVEAEDAYRDGDYPLALTHLFGALEREPDLPQSLLLLGTTYYRLRRYRDAIAAFERFAEVLPGESWRLQALGHCYYGLGRYADAEATYHGVLARLPESVEALRGLGLCRLRQDAPDEALELLNRVVALRPGHAEAWAWIAEVHLDEGRLGQAEAAAERARDLDPFLTRPHYLLALSRFALGDEPGAAAARARFEELDALEQDVRAVEVRLLLAPHDTALLLRLAELRHAAGDGVRTREALERLLNAWPAALPPRQPAARAIALLRGLGDLAGVRAVAAWLEARAGADAAAWALLAQAWESTGDGKRAAAAATRLAELGGG